MTAAVMEGQVGMFDLPPRLTPDDAPEILQRPDFEEKRHRYTMGSKWMPGVTSVLGILDKPALPWWGMRVGLRAAHRIVQDGYDVASFSADPQIPDKNDVGDWERITKELKLTTNHVRDDAADRGTAAHNAAEAYVKYGTPFDLASMTPKAKGYVQSAAGFFVEVEPQKLASEFMVWSLKRWYAGTADLLLRIDGKLGLWDLKSSKDVYDTHWLQLAAYEDARRELKLDPVEEAGVIHLTPDGEFAIDTHLKRIDADELEASIKEWRAIKAAFDALQARKDRHKKRRK